MNYDSALDAAIDRLHEEGRYRTFIDIERRRGQFPHAIWKKPDGTEQEITVWCGNDYLGMGQHPKVLEAMHEALDAIHDFDLDGISDAWEDRHGLDKSDPADADLDADADGQPDGVAGDGQAADLHSPPTARRRR